MGTGDGRRESTGMHGAFSSTHLLIAIANNHIICATNERCGWIHDEPNKSMMGRADCVMVAVIVAMALPVDAGSCVCC